MLKRVVLMLLASLVVARWAAAQADEPQTPVDRIIKAAQNLRLDELTSIDLQPRPSSGVNELYLGGQLVNLSGDARLEDRLIGRARTFTDGPRVESDLAVDQFRLGYRYQLQSGEERGGLPVAIRSVVGLAVLDLKYQMGLAEVADSEQGYLKGAPLMGFEMEWRATRVFSIASEISSTLPLSNMPWIFTTQVLGRVQLAKKRDAGVRAFMGIGYERISLQGDLITDINSDSGPRLLLGLEARF